MGELYRMVYIESIYQTLSQEVTKCQYYYNIIPWNRKDLRILEEDEQGSFVVL